jgi:hypothetical protein
MITVGDVTEYEPPTPKILGLTSSIVAMLAGDMGLQSELIGDLKDFVNGRIARKPTEWLKVKDVVEWYTFYYSQAKLKRAENQVLMPLGLTRHTYLKEHPDLSAKLAKELVNYEMPGIETIITGIDTTGPHIYVTDGVDIRCSDSSGFAAVGTGAWHASSQFMLARHGFNSPLPETLLRVYISKKRAEVAPGVGKDTDMFFIGPQIGSSSSIRQDIIDKLDKIYTKLILGEKKTLKSAEAEMKSHVKRLTKAATKKAQAVAPPTDGGRAPALEAPPTGPEETQPEPPQNN